ncbi:MAG: asparagine synthase-related protein [bacterium]
MSAISGYVERHRNGRARDELTVWFDAPASEACTVDCRSRDEDPCPAVRIEADVRLDNRAELLARLSLPGVSVLSDASLILCAWKKWGRACPNYLVGDFAFAIWDPHQRSVFCARDHIGARPFHYAIMRDRFAFASDIRSVLAAPGVSDALDDAYVAATLLDRMYMSNDRTYYAAIRKLPPGHSLTLRADGERLERYWHPSQSPDVRFAAPADYAAAAREIFRQAVRDRLATQDNVGVHLSGGLDSSSVAVMVAREQRAVGKRAPIALSWQPPPDAESMMSWEHTCIDAVARREGLPVHYCPMNPGDVLEMLRKDPTREPVTSTMIIEATTQRCAAALGIRVILSGFGGDEGLSSKGNGYSAELLVRGRWNALYRESRRRHDKPLKHIAAEALLLLFPDRDTASNRLAARRWRTPYRAAQWMQADFLRRATPLRSLPSRQASVRSSLVWWWENGYLTERMESWAFHGRPHGLSYAYPLLDRRLLEFVAGLPSEQLARGPSPRAFMRRVTEGILPVEFAAMPDKPSDIVRTTPAFGVARRALALAGEQLAALPSAPLRACYVNVANLLPRLRPEALEGSVRLGDLLRTVQFLDF